MNATKSAEPDLRIGPPARAPAASLQLDLQLAPLDDQHAQGLPNATELQHWALTAVSASDSPRLQAIQWPAELTIRICDEVESAALNQQYRGKPGPTNVLSFPAEPPPGIVTNDPLFAEIHAMLGDLLICAPLVRREAAEQGKTEQAHWAHLVVHGCLHLLGYDHITAAEAASMETLEIEILGALGFPSPYEVIDDANGERRRI
jgi:probable rRNA maturation factor